MPVVVKQVFIYNLNGCNTPYFMSVLTPFYCVVSKNCHK